MKSNLGSPDKIIRILIAVAVLVLYLTHVISGTLGIVLLVVGGVLALTAIINFCPIYFVLGLRTNKKEK